MPDRDTRHYRLFFGLKGQQLNRDPSIEFRIVSLVNYTHAPATELIDDHTTPHTSASRKFLFSRLVIVLIREAGILRISECVFPFHSVTPTISLERFLASPHPPSSVKIEPAIPFSQRLQAMSG